MRAADRKKAAGASAISVALHGLFLAAMVLGLREVKLPAETPPIEVTLVPPPIFTPVRKAETPTPSPQRTQAAAPVLRPHLAPLVAPDAPPALAVPEAKAPAAPTAPGINPGDFGDKKGLLPSLTGQAGCDDPLSFHLDDKQRAACNDKLAQTAKTAKPLALAIAAANLAAYEKNIRCKGPRGGAMPSLSAKNDSTGAQIGGLGYNPSLRDCGVKDRQ